MIIGKATRTVTIGGEPLDPSRSQSIINHSPDGFSWGYAGSGPAQLALALLLEFADEDFARRYHQEFKTDVIAKLPDMRHFEMTEQQVKLWITRQRKAANNV